MCSSDLLNDDNYNILITKDNGNLSETLFTNISPNATVKITNDTAVIKTDGNGVYNFIGNGKFQLNNDFITMHGGERELKIKIKNGKIKSIDGFTEEDVLKVSKSGNIRINGKKIAAEYKINDKLPTIRQLAKEYSTSEKTIKRALPPTILTPPA